MNRKAQRFFENLAGKTAAFCGYGRSNNLSIIRMFCENGAAVTVRDKRSREQLGEDADKMEACGARLILECLDRSLYPSWDAHNPASLSLAEQLSYQLDHSYTAFELTD